LFGLASPATAAVTTAEAQLDQLLTRYVHEFLRRNPVVATYLGGAALAPDLSDVDGTLRDYAPPARRDEATFLAHLQAQLKAINPAQLSAPHRIDREVALRQIAFMRHQDEARNTGAALSIRTSKSPFAASIGRCKGWPVKRAADMEPRTSGVSSSRAWPPSRAISRRQGRTSKPVLPPVTLPIGA
jgi:uncharacterized protein (DUF885 family)